MHSRLWLVLAITGLALGTAGAEPDLTTAAEHYRAAETARDQGDFDTAVKEFLSAQEISADPAIYRQVAKTYELAGKKAEAADYYKRYLAAVPELSPDERAELEEKVKELEGDGKTGETLTPPDETPPPDITDPVPPPSFADQAPRWQRTAAWVSVGVGAVLLATGGVLGMSAAAREDEVLRLVEFRDPLTTLPKEYTASVRADYEDKVAEGNKLETYSQIAFLGAGVAVAAATVFFVLDATAGDGPKAPSVGLPVDLIFGPDGGGVSARWEF